MTAKTRSGHPEKHEELWDQSQIWWSKVIGLLMFWNPLGHTRFPDHTEYILPYDSLSTP